MTMTTELTPTTTADIRWPEKRDVFGVGVSLCEIEEATEAVMAAARVRHPSVVSCFSVHALVNASDDDSMRQKANSFEMVTTDGQPVRWAVNLLHKAGLRRRVCGRMLVESVCAAAVRDGVSIYLYGGQPQVVADLKTRLEERYPGLQIAGYESPPFRALTEEEVDAAIDRINSSGAGVVLLGLGCPKQDLFAYAHRPRIRAVQLCVGAVFDFFAGSQPVAPQWMQNAGLEWLYRLSSEPRRLFGRYAKTNSAFVWKLSRSLVTPRRRALATARD